MRNSNGYCDNKSFNNFPLHCDIFKKILILNMANLTNGSVEKEPEVLNLSNL
jgi:hypothetical protein